MNDTHPPADVDALHDFLNRAERDASARASDFDRIPLTSAFADAELQVIAVLRDLVTKDDGQARAFVRRWRTLVETTDSDEFPQRRGAVFARTDDITWVIGEQLLRCAVTVFDAFVRDDVVKTYRVLGTVEED